MSPEPARGFRLLPWDSALFGFSVAHIPTAAIHAGQLPETVEALRADGVRLAYAAVPWSDTGAATALASAGARLVDRKVRYRKEAISRLPMPAGVESVIGSPCTPDLEHLALASGASSRFRADPEVPSPVFEKLYLAWIHRSLAGEIAQEVLVIRDGQTCAGMVTVAGSDSCPTGTIGLIAVEGRHRGKGYGRRLMIGAEAWCAERGMTALDVVTQMRNVAACGLYTACGFGIIGDDAVFHLWIGRSR